jgi:hypothetical protein
MKTTLNPEEPKDNIYAVPAAFEKGEMHYGIVQISKRNYVVMEYGYTWSMSGVRIPHFHAVSGPLSSTKADVLAAQLTRARTDAKPQPK